MLANICSVPAAKRTSAPTVGWRLRQVISTKSETTANATPDRTSQESKRGKPDTSRPMIAKRPRWVSNRRRRKGVRRRPKPGCASPANAIEYSIATTR